MSDKIRVEFGVKIQSIYLHKESVSFYCDFDDLGGGPAEMRRAAFPMDETLAGIREQLVDYFKKKAEEQRVK